MNLNSDRDSKNNTGSRQSNLKLVIPIFFLLKSTAYLLCVRCIIFAFHHNPMKKTLLSSIYRESNRVQETDLLKITRLVTSKLGYDPELPNAKAFPLHFLHTLYCLEFLRPAKEAQD